MSGSIHYVQMHIIKLESMESSRNCSRYLFRSAFAFLKIHVVYPDFFYLTKLSSIECCSICDLDVYDEKTLTNLYSTSDHKKVFY